MSRNGFYSFFLVLGFIAVGVMPDGSLRGASMQEYGSEEKPASPEKREFVKNGCYQCHGFQGHGGGGPRLAPKPMPYEAFVRAVRKPRGEMPAYSPKVLSDAKIQIIYDYLKTVPPPPAVSEIPLLSGDGK